MGGWAKVTIFIYFGLFSFVGMLLLWALLGTQMPGFATGRIVLGVFVVVLSGWAIAKAQIAKQAQERAFKSGNWATATVVRASGGVDTPLFVTFKVHGPSCEFEQTEQVTGDFRALLDCPHGTDCLTGKEVRVALGEPPCSSAHADPRAGVLDRKLLTWASAIAALAGLIFIWSGFRFRRLGRAGS